ncbi:hypothetical protein CLU79DRAFT_837206 [Phycomyces nitens]|nr:hypothetical protein CLU79DRAFT_837206 [Phycomyces nitens]
MSVVKIGPDRHLFFLFSQKGEEMQYDVYAEGLSSDGACISWSVGLDHISPNDNDACSSRFQGGCIDDIVPGVCTLGLKENGPCHSKFSVTGLSVSNTSMDKRTLIHSGTTNKTNIKENDINSIAESSIIVNYLFKGNSSPRSSCSNLHTGNGDIDSFVISSGTISTSYPKFIRTVLLVSTLYYMVF